MPYYAQCDEKTGEVKCSIHSAVRWVEIPAPLPSGRFMLRNGEIIPCPELIISAMAEVKADMPFELKIETLDFPDAMPDYLQIQCDDTIAGWKRDTWVSISDAGEHTLRIVGPWPWESNKIHVKVTEAADGPT